LSWQGLGGKRDLKGEEKKKLAEIIRGLIEYEPTKRLLTKEAIKKTQFLGSEIDFAKVVRQHYIKKAKEFLALGNPNTLSLNSDIKSTRSKGIIAQYLTKSNPRRSKTEAMRCEK
jgi:hypothetical protein